MADLSRLREIIKASRRPSVSAELMPHAASVRHGGSAPALDEIAATLGGEVCEGTRGTYVIVRRRVDGQRRAGDSRIEQETDLDPTALDLLARSSESSADPPTGGRSGPVLFLDLETTGLSGGAGTVAFLVGVGFFSGGAFHTSQYVLTSMQAEPALLAGVGPLLESASAVVTFNGKSFDLPVMETRWLFHRMPLPWAGAPHLDLLHPARRLWRYRRCTLAALEEIVLGVTRKGDVPGAEIPARYFGYLRRGDATLLLPVLEHNHLDLLSLAVLTARSCRLVNGGAAAATDERQCLGLGRLYDRAGRCADAMTCYQAAAEMADAAARAEQGAATAARRVTSGDEPPVQVEARYRIALRLRRERRFEDAAHVWQQLAGMRGVPPVIMRDATAALAMHHEHRVKDFGTASVFARRTLASETDPTRRQAARHRLARLKRKLAAAGRSTDRRRSHSPVSEIGYLEGSLAKGGYPARE